MASPVPDGGAGDPHNRWGMVARSITPDNARRHSRVIQIPEDILLDVIETWQSPSAGKLIQDLASVRGYRAEMDRTSTPCSDLAPSTHNSVVSEPEFISKPRSALVEGIEVQKWLIKHAKPGMAHGLNKPRLTYAERRELRSIFDALDADMSGTLDKDEFRAALVGKPIISFEILDTDGSNDVNFEEFVQTMAAPATHASTGLQPTFSDDAVKDIGLVARGVRATRLVDMIIEPFKTRKPPQLLPSTPPGGRVTAMQLLPKDAIAATRLNFAISEAALLRSRKIEFVRDRALAAQGLARAQGELPVIEIAFDATAGKMFTTHKENATEASWDYRGTSIKNPPGAAAALLKSTSRPSGAHTDRGPSPGSGHGMDSRPASAAAHVAAAPPPRRMPDDYDVEGNWIVPPSIRMPGVIGFRAGLAAAKIEHARLQAFAARLDVASGAAPQNGGPPPLSPREVLGLPTPRRARVIPPPRHVGSPRRVTTAPRAIGLYGPRASSAPLPPPQASPGHQPARKLSVVWADGDDGYVREDDDDTSYVHGLDGDYAGKAGRGRQQLPGPTARPQTAGPLRPQQLPPQHPDEVAAADASVAAVTLGLGASARRPSSAAASAGPLVSAMTPSPPIVPVPMDRRPQPLQVVVLRGDLGEVGALGTAGTDDALKEDDAGGTGAQEDPNRFFGGEGSQPPSQPPSQPVSRGASPGAPLPSKPLQRLGSSYFRKAKTATGLAKTLVWPPEKEEWKSSARATTAAETVPPPLNLPLGRRPSFLRRPSMGQGSTPLSGGPSGPEGIDAAKGPGMRVGRRGSESQLNLMPVTSLAPRTTGQTMSSPRDSPDGGRASPFLEGLREEDDGATNAAPQPPDAAATVFPPAEELSQRPPDPVAVGASPSVSRTNSMMVRRTSFGFGSAQPRGYIPPSLIAITPFAVTPRHHAPVTPAAPTSATAMSRGVSFNSQSDAEGVPPAEPLLNAGRRPSFRSRDDPPSLGPTAGPPPGVSAWQGSTPRAMEAAASRLTAMLTPAPPPDGSPTRRKSLGLAQPAMFIATSQPPPAAEGDDATSSSPVGKPRRSGRLSTIPGTPTGGGSFVSGDAMSRSARRPFASDGSMTGSSRFMVPSGIGAGSGRMTSGGWAAASGYEPDVR